MKLESLPLKVLALLIVLASWLVPGNSAQAAESLDPSFGEAGIAIPGPRGCAVFALAQNADGNLIGGGTSFESFLVASYLSDGSFDLAFGDEEGFIIQPMGHDSRIHSIAIQRDGKIVTAGASKPGAFLLTRYDQNGLPDFTFGKRGRVRKSTGRILRKGGGARSLAFQSSGRILVAGYGINERYRWRAIVLAYRPNGEPDPTFGDEGRKDFRTIPGFALQFRDMVVLPNDKILLAGSLAGRVLLVRLHPNGDRDRSFGGGDGELVTDVDGSKKCRCVYTTGLAVDHRGRILVSANATGPNRFAQRATITRYMPNGRVDRSFGSRGTVRSLIGSRLASRDLVIQKDGRIVLAGAHNVPATGEARVAVVRYLPDGRLDPTFGRSGYFTRDMGVESVAYAALVQRDGRVVVAGRRNLKQSPFEEEIRSVYDEAEVFLMRFLP